MTDSFTIHTNTPHCLNFMIYIQNIYLNQKGKKENFRFPYIAKTLHFSSDFETNFKELWHSLRKQIANDRYDLQFFMKKTISSMRSFLTPNYVMKTLLKN